MTQGNINEVFKQLAELKANLIEAKKVHDDEKSKFAVILKSYTQSKKIMEDLETEIIELETTFLYPTLARFNNKDATQSTLIFKANFKGQADFCAKFNNVNFEFK